MTLYEITDQIRACLDTIDGGELTDEQLVNLETYGLNLDTKIDSCCGLIREWESFVAVRNAEIDRLRAGIDTYQNSIKRLKDYMKKALETIGQSKHETALFKTWIQKSSPSASFDGAPESLPAEFKRVKVEPDNKAAIEAWKANTPLPVGFAVQQSTHLRIK